MLIHLFKSFFLAFGLIMVVSRVDAKTEAREMVKMETNEYYKTLLEITVSVFAIIVNYKLFCVFQDAV